MLIETPYGRKTPELLVKSMDAHTALPEVLAVLKAFLDYGNLGAYERADVCKRARAAITKLERIAP